jgi:hypothetical protein
VACDPGRLSTLEFRQFGISEPKWFSSVSRNRTATANWLYLLEATIRSVRVSRNTDSDQSSTSVDGRDENERERRKSFAGGFNRSAQHRLETYQLEF